MNDCPGVVNMHLSAESTRTEHNVQKTTMLYKVEGGTVQDDNYGIDIARTMGFPPKVIEVAQEVSDAIRDRAAANRRGARGERLIKRRKYLLELKERLLIAHESTMGDYELSEHLRALQKEAVETLLELESDVEAENMSVDSGSVGGEGEPWL